MKVISPDSETFQGKCLRRILPIFWPTKSPTMSFTEDDQMQEMEMDRAYCSIKAV